MVHQYGYDAVGNRTSKLGPLGSTTYGHESATNRLDSASGAEARDYAHDAYGNRIYDGTASYASTPSLVYDDANRLVEMRQAGTRFTYAYDADGLRIAQTEHGATPVTTHWLQDGSHAYSQVIEAHREQGGTTQLEAVYNFADGLLSQTRYAAGVASTRFVHQDGFGSTRLLSDGAAGVTDRWSYDAFGNEIAREGSTPTEHLYRGEQLDPNLGFYYLRARYMDSNLGRMLGTDPFRGAMSDPATLHKYLYGRSDPVRFIDPSGEIALVEGGERGLQLRRVRLDLRAQPLGAPGEEPRVPERSLGHQVGGGGGEKENCGDQGGGAHGRDVPQLEARATLLRGRIG